VCLPHYRLNDLNALSGLAHSFAAAARAVTRRFCPRLHNRVLRRLIRARRGVITSPQPDGPYLLVGRRLFSLLCVRRCHLVGSSSPVAALRDMELGLLRPFGCLSDRPSRSARITTWSPPMCDSTGNARGRIADRHLACRHWSNTSSKSRWNCSSRCWNCPSSRNGLPARGLLSRTLERRRLQRVPAGQRERSSMRGFTLYGSTMSPSPLVRQ
jgi:hypothetical protein